MVYETTIRDLEQAISNLKAEKERIDQQLQALSASLHYFEGQESTSERVGKRPQTPPPGQADSESSERKKQGGPDGGLRNAMAEILAAEGPLHRREIYERLVRLGVQIGGQDPINNLSAHLSLDSRFENVGVGIWQLREPQTEAGVDAEEVEEEDVPW